MTAKQWTASQEEMLQELTAANYKPDDLTRHTYFYLTEDGPQVTEKHDRYTEIIASIDDRKEAYLISYQWAGGQELAGMGRWNGPIAEDNLNLKVAREAYRAYCEEK